MPTSSKIPPVERGAGLRLPRMAVFGLLALVAVILAASAAFHILAAPRADADLGQGGSADWAGIVPGDKQANLYGPKEAPLTSSDYTSGFDTNAAGLGPLPETKPVLKLVPPADARACPNDLNCTFRPINRAGPLPPARNVAALDPDQAMNEGPRPPSPPPPSGLGLLTANLHLPIHLPNRWPSANTLLKPANTLILKPAGNLLKPFANVSNTVGSSVVSFVKKL